LTGSLAERAFAGTIWTAAERFGVQVIQFAVVIVLARLLVPEDFGLVAMLMVIFAVSSVLVNGGFTEALIREREITQADKATAFWLNLMASVVIYGVIWVAAPAVAAFFEYPELVGLTRFMALSLIFLALTLVQQADLTHQLAFKRLGVVSVAAAAVTGVVAITLALLGAGVWALAAKYVLMAACTSLFLGIANPWLPTQGISRDSVHKLFGFGSKLAASGLLNEVYQNVYKVVIGKFFAAATLGFYTQAQNFTNMASQSLVGAVQKVTYPLLSKTNDDPKRLKRGYRKIIQVSSYVIFPAMVGLALVAEPLVLTLIGEQWRQTVPFLQILCVSGALYHLHSINLNVLKVVGRSDLFLKLEVIKKVNITIAIIIGLQFGIWGLLIGQVVSSCVALFINMYYTRVFIDYSMSEQLADILGVLWLSAPMGVLVWLTGELAPSSPLLELVLMITMGLVVYIFVGAILRAPPLSTILDLLRSSAFREPHPGPKTGESLVKSE
jgi:O-antigen/teichoic acid export membrane protein